MKKTRFLVVMLAFAVIATTLFTAFKKADVTNNHYENCGEWTKIDGISMRQCSDGDRYSHQFFNGYNFEVHFYVILTHTDGTQTCSGNGCWINLYLGGGEYSGSAENDGAGTKSIQYWRVTKKERKDSNGKWVEF